MRRNDPTADAQREGRADAVAGRPPRFTEGPVYSWAWRYVIGYNLGLSWMNQIGYAPP